ncbi:hypothetical protein PtB15_2B188 [Puccinia triticina]|nr:hypothetical protein PtB15_2B188 [Puccinia triticina]
MSHSRSPSTERQTKRKRSISPTDGNVPPLHRKRRSASPAERPADEEKREPFERIQVDVPRIHDSDPARRREREEQLRIRLAEQELAGIVKPKPDPKLEMQKMAATRGGGAYIPPARLRAMQAQMDTPDPSSPEYQRIRWDALRKSINGLINKVNVGNIKFIVPELFGENLIRGRGLFARSIMRAQASSLPFTPVFAALVSVINTKLPTVGELIVTRVVSQFRRAYRRNDKVTCVATSTFVAQLVNQQVAHHLLAFEIIILLLEKPTDDSVEIAVGFTKEVGAFLSEAEPKANNSVYERFRSILHEATISKRVQYMIEVLFQVRKDRFKDNLVLPEGLDLVEEDDIITHPIHLDDDLQVQDTLNVFKFDPDYAENEEKYQSIKNEILGVDSDSGSSGSESGSDEESSEEEPDTGIVDGKVTIHDHSETNLINFRRNVYLTIMSSLDFEEAAHKLLKRNIEEGLELELANMVVECCSQERSYAKFYGLLGERFCKLNQTWTMTFDQCFRNYYDTIHRFETNRLRNIARFFGHLLAQDAIPWSVFEVIRMNEDDTTSSSRIFVKIMFQEITEVLGLKRLAERFKDPSMQVWFGGLFPIDNPKNTRFSINYFTSIGLGVLTEEMREHLKRAPQLIMAKRRELDEAESSDDDDSSSDISSISSTDSRMDDAGVGGIRRLLHPVTVEARLEDGATRDRLADAATPALLRVEAETPDLRLSAVVTLGRRVDAAPPRLPSDAEARLLLLDAVDRLRPSDVEALAPPSDAVDRLPPPGVEPPLLQLDVEARRLLIDAAIRHLLPDAEARHLLLDAEARHLLLDAEARHLLLDAEARHLLLDAEARRLLLDAEARRFLQDAEARRPRFDTLIHLLPSDASIYLLRSDAAIHLLPSDVVTHPLPSDGEALRLPSDAVAPHHPSDVVAPPLLLDVEARLLPSDAADHRPRLDAAVLLLLSDAAARLLRPDAAALLLLSGAAALRLL